MKGIIALPVIVLVLFLGFLGFVFISGHFKTNNPQKNGQFSEEKNNGIEVFYEEILGSKFHDPDATWWGYNQTKIVRFGNIVFTYVIENTDDSNKTASLFVIYKKEGDKSWEKGASFTTSRPGNILIDSQGVLHAFVFEPFNVAKNDSWGKLKHYSFPNSRIGNITNYEEEIVIDNDGTNETVNIRVGAAIGQDDTMALGFGLTTYNPQYSGHSEHLYFKKPADAQWKHLIAGENLGHDWYYPFVWVDKDEFYLLPVQDDFTGQGNPNIYQKIMYFAYQNGQWEKEIITDLTSHTLAKSRPRLLEQEELFVDKNGNVHIIYKEFLDPDKSFTATAHWHLSGKQGAWKSEKINLGKMAVNWIRLTEVDGNLYYILTTFREVFISPVEHMKLTKIDLPDDARGMYPYLSTSKGGSTDSEYVDLLLLGADQKLYQQGKNVNYYLRIPKEEFTR